MRQLTSVLILMPWIRFLPLARERQSLRASRRAKSIACFAACEICISWARTWSKYLLPSIPREEQHWRRQILRLKFCAYWRSPQQNERPKGGAGFSLWGLGLARTKPHSLWRLVLARPKPHRLKSALLKPHPLAD